MAPSQASTLFQRAAEAYRLYARHLLSNAIRSPLDRAGCGWQQIWKSPHPGVYASCDGLLILDRLELQDPLRKQAEAIAEQVFHHHLRLIADTRVPTNGEEHRINRRDSRSITMKVAKILQASSTSLVSMRTPLPPGLMNQLRGRLDSVGRRRGPGWPPCLSLPSSELSVFATAEALRALRPAAAHYTSFNAGIAYLLQHLSTQDKPRIDESVEREIVALWGISEVCSHVPKATLRRAAARLLSYLSQPYAHAYHKAEIKFNSLGRDDYYSYNATFIAATAVLNFIQAGILSVSVAGSVIGPIDEAIERIIRFLNLWPTIIPTEHYFWDQAQALNLLASFIDTANKYPTLKEYKAMNVSPIHFHDHQFVVQRDLCVVLMPFKPRWSKDVFKTFEDTVKSKKFQIWRSDLEFGDDNIMQTIWARINTARFIIADCTDRNPNVFYELGIAHTIGKKVFICAQDKKHIPFDLGHIRYVTYGTLESEIVTLKAAITKFIGTL